MIVVHRKITWLLLFSIISLFIASWLIYVSKDTQERTNARIYQTHEILGMIRQLQFSVAPPAPRAELQQYLDSLIQLTKSNHDQQPGIPLLHKYLQQPITKPLSD